MADLIHTPTEHVGRLTIRNVGDENEMKAEIAGPANRSAAQEHTIVVSDYRPLVQALDRGDARVYSSEQFLSKVRASLRRSGESLSDEPDAKFMGVSEEEVDGWLSFFDEEQ